MAALFISAFASRGIVHPPFYPPELELPKVVSIGCIYLCSWKFIATNGLVSW